MLYDLIFFFQAEDGIRVAQEYRGLGDVYKRQETNKSFERFNVEGTRVIHFMPFLIDLMLLSEYRALSATVLHQLDQKIIYPHYDFKHLTKKYFEIGMKLDDFLILSLIHISEPTRLLSISYAVF